jgi:hypothetical protein
MHRSRLTCLTTWILCTALIASPVLAQNSPAKAERTSVPLKLSLPHIGVELPAARPTANLVEPPQSKTSNPGRKSVVGLLLLAGAGAAAVLAIVLSGDDDRPDPPGTPATILAAGTPAVQPPNN